jgi:hypothetical protein
VRAAISDVVVDGREVEQLRVDIADLLPRSKMALSLIGKPILHLQALDHPDGRRAWITATFTKLFMKFMLIYLTLRFVEE